MLFSFLDCSFSLKYALMLRNFRLLSMNIYKWRYFSFFACLYSICVVPHESVKMTWFHVPYLCFAGAILVTLCRIFLKTVFQFLVKNIYHLMGLSVFNSSKYRLNLPPNVKHYTERFKLPPIYVSCSQNRFVVVR